MKESYADFSIIKKYFDQQKMFDQELQGYKDQIVQLEERIKYLTEQCAKRDKIIAQLSSLKEKAIELNNKLKEANQHLAEKDTSIRQLNARVRELTSSS